MGEVVIGIWAFKENLKLCYVGIWAFNGIFIKISDRNMGV